MTQVTTTVDSLGEMFFDVADTGTPGEVEIFVGSRFHSSDQLSHFSFDYSTDGPTVAGSGDITLFGLSSQPTAIHDGANLPINFWVDESDITSLTDSYGNPLSISNFANKPWEYGNGVSDGVVMLSDETYAIDHVLVVNDTGDGYIHYEIPRGLANSNLGSWNADVSDAGISYKINESNMISEYYFAFDGSGTGPIATPDFEVTSMPTTESWGTSSLIRLSDGSHLYESKNVDLTSELAQPALTLEFQSAGQTYNDGTSKWLSTA